MVCLSAKVISELSIACFGKGREKETTTLETSCAYGKANVCMFPPISKGTQQGDLQSKF